MILYIKVNGVSNINRIETENIDLEIKNIDDIIFESIEQMKDYNRGFLSEHILKSLRDLIEHTAIKILSYAKGFELELNYANIKEAIKFIENRGQYKFLAKFHRFLQNSVGHRTPTNDNAERLMLKYYEYLLRLKNFYRDSFQMEILKNINKFPLNTDKTYYEYYGEIANKINNISTIRQRKFISGRYYIQKIKPFFIENKIYYEVTLSPAVDNPSKFDRITMYTKCELNTSYSIKVSVAKEKVKVFGALTDIQIITTWEISIRPCEICNFYKIFGKEITFSASNKEYKEIMPFLTRMNYSLLDLVDLDEVQYEKIKRYFNDICKTNYIISLVDKCKYIINNNKIGTNTIRYLLYKCNNAIMKRQYKNEPNETMSGLFLKRGCMPFEEMPFVTSLVKHNPKSYDLFECLNCNNRKDELLARYVQINTQQNGCLYTEKSELDFLGDVNELVKSYNSRLYLPKHKNRELIVDGQNVYMRGYEEDTIQIIDKLKELSREGIRDYRNSVEIWLNTGTYYIDDEDKKEVLKNLFSNSKVAFIYGAAGTGKTTMINHISNYYNNDKKIYLANTHPAVENLKRKVSAQNCEFYTIKKALSDNFINKDCDILIIDECSTVSNEDMLNILTNINFELLVLVGDIYQIESIIFGNWFEIAKMLMKDKIKFELTVPYRSKNENLKILWNKVRNLDEEIVEWMSINRYSQRLDESILIPNDDDEIILCLNYDGLYGINNINRFIQNSNENKPVDWGIGTYKVGDPILFNESNRFAPIIYNNLKGKIKRIQVEETEHRIWFDIEVDTVIDEEDADLVGLTLIENNEKKSTIRFYVNEFKDLDEDDDINSDAVVPFFIAYAVSIHKSQGLEYNSVKIIITQEIEENISHNIFYTAITRAMNKLKIYWTPECQNKIIKNMKFKFNVKDACIIKEKIKNKKL